MHQRPPTHACEDIYTFPLAASVLSVGIQLLQQYFNMCLSSQSHIEPEINLDVLTRQSGFFKFVVLFL